MVRDSALPTAGAQVQSSAWGTKIGKQSSMTHPPPPPPQKKYWVPTTSKSLEVNPSTSFNHGDSNVQPGLTSDIKYLANTRYIPFFNIAIIKTK